MSAITRLIAPSVGVLGFGIVYAPSEVPIKQLATGFIGPSVQRASHALNDTLTRFGMTPMHRYDNGTNIHVKHGVGMMATLK